MTQTNFCEHHWAPLYKKSLWYYLIMKWQINGQKINVFASNTAESFTQFSKEENSQWHDNIHDQKADK